MFKALHPVRRTLLACLLAAGVALVLLAVLATAPAAAETKTGHQFTYYSNPAHTGAVVGYRFYCPNESGGWGTITPYDVIGSYPCNP